MLGPTGKKPQENDYLQTLFMAKDCIRVWLEEWTLKGF